MSPDEETISRLFEGSTEAVKRAYERACFYGGWPYDHPPAYSRHMATTIPCGWPRCPNRVVLQTDVGRPKQYCCAACRAAAGYARNRERFLARYRETWAAVREKRNADLREWRAARRTKKERNECPAPRPRGARPASVA